MIVDANRFKEAFEEAQRILEENENLNSSDEEDDDEKGAEDNKTQDEVKEENETKNDEVIEKFSDLKVDAEKV